MISHTFWFIKKEENKFLSDQKTIKLDTLTEDELLWNSRNQYVIVDKDLFTHSSEESDDRKRIKEIKRKLWDDFQRFLEENNYYDSRENYHGWVGPAVTVSVGYFEIEWISNYGYNQPRHYSLAKLRYKGLYIKEHSVDNSKEFCAILNDYLNIGELQMIGIIEELAKVLAHFRSIIPIDTPHVFIDGKENKSPKDSIEVIGGTNLLYYNYLKSALTNR